MLDEPERATAFLRATRARLRSAATVDALLSTFAMNAGSPQRALELADAVLAAPDAEDALYAEVLAELDELEDNREFRLLAVNEGIPYIVWVVLVVGGVLTVGFTYLFGMESVRLHAVAVAGLTILVSLILHAIGVLDYPFNSGVRVQPDAFEHVLREIRGNGGP